MMMRMTMMKLDRLMLGKMTIVASLHGSR